MQKLNKELDRRRKVQKTDRRMLKGLQNLHTLFTLYNFVQPLAITFNKR